MSHGWYSPQRRFNSCGHATQLTLSVEELTKGIGHMDCVDLARINLGIDPCLGQNFGNDIADVELLLGVILRKVSLETAKDVYVVRHTTDSSRRLI